YSWTVPPVDGKQARVRVQLFDTLGTLLTWGTSAAFALDSTPPGAISLASPANGACGSGTPALDWNDASGATNYTVTFFPARGPSRVKTGLAASTYAVAAGETFSSADSPVHWEVTAFDAAGNSTTSQSHSFVVDTTAPADFALAAPANGTTTALSGLT